MFKKKCGKKRGGLSFTAIGKKYSRDRHTISNICKKNGIK